MESPSVVVPPAAPLALPPHRHGPSLMTLVLVSGALSSLIFLTFYGRGIIPSVNSFNEWVVVQGVSGPEWYAFGVGSLTGPRTLPGFEGQPFMVVAASPMPTEGDIAVLARIPNQPGTVLGIVHKDKSFTPVISDGSVKYDLAVRADGLAVYTSAEFPSVTNGTSTSVGRALADTDVAAFLKSGQPIPLRLKLINLQHPNGVQDAGEGISPRATTQGQFVAITTAGLVTISPLTLKATTLLPISSRVAVGSITPDGKFVALPTGSKLSVYRIDSVDPATITLIGTSMGVPTRGITLMSESKLYAADARGHVQIYAQDELGIGDQYFHRTGMVNLTRQNP